ncbi:hypothetical protein ACE3NQ_04835 [Paenibacillus terreus]|uniref:Uncharacterized protein n=1 Tax=Paenibacillus terreus TaxID=1387834 RepID=A0ABV5B5M9_9BACL
MGIEKVKKYWCCKRGRLDKGIPEQDARSMQRQLQKGGMMMKIDCGSEKRYRPLCVPKASSLQLAEHSVTICAVLFIVMR